MEEEIGEGGRGERGLTKRRRSAEKVITLKDFNTNTHKQAIRETVYRSPLKKFDKERGH